MHPRTMVDGAAGSTSEFDKKGFGTLWVVMILVLYIFAFW